MKSKFQWVYLGLSALLFLDCIWTDSRAAWVAIPISVGIIASFKKPKWGLVAAGVALLIMGATYLTNQGFRSRVDRTLFQKDDFYNLGPRARLWQVHWQIFKDNPLFGIGFNNNEAHAKEYEDRMFPNAPYKFYGHAHSTPLQILASMGILGMLCYLWIWVAIFRRNLWALKRFPRGSLEWGLSVGVFAAFIGFHIQGLTQWNFGDAEVLHSLMFSWAVLGALPE